MMPVIIFAIAAAVYLGDAKEPTIHLYNHSFKTIEACEQSRKAVVADLQQQIGDRGFVLESACVARVEQGI